MEPKTIKQELNDLFLDLSKKNATPEAIALAQATGQGVEGVVPTGVVEPPAQTAPEPGKAPETTAASADQPITPKPEPVKPQTVDVDGVVDGWDSESPVVTPPVQPTTVQTPTSYDFSDFAKVLGKDDLKSKDDVVKVVSEIKAKVDSLATLPEPLAKAIEIANLNGDYLSYLGVSQIDWSKEDPVLLYENYITNQFTDAQTGNVDFERVDKFLDRLDEDEKELRGKELQKGYIAQQQYQKQQIEQQARAQKQNFEQSLRRTIDSLSEIAGYKLTPSHKEELYSYISHGEDLMESDLSNRVVNAFVKKNFNKIDSFRKQQIRNAVKKEILEEAVLPEVKPVSATPDVSKPSTGYTLDDYLKDLQNKQKRTFN